MFEWKWEFTLEILPRLLQATLNTLMAAGSGYAIALILGLVFVLGQRTSSPILTGVIREIVEEHAHVLQIGRASCRERV